MKLLPPIVASAIALATLCPLAATAAAPLGKLTAKPVANKLGLHLNDYALRWDGGGKQSYQILVASNEKKLAAEVGDLWDSGRRFGTSVHSIPYRGSAMPSGSTVWWKVRTWEFGDERGEWSEPAKIEIANTQDTTQPIPRPTAVEGEIKFVDGKLGEAIHLGGSSTVRADNYPALHSSKGTTISAWIKPDRVGDSWQCIYRKESNARRLLAIGKEGPFWGLWCGLGIGGKYVEVGAPYDANNLKDGNWHHVAASFDGEHVRLFVDGKKIGEERHPGLLGAGDASPAFIGSHGGASERFHGGIDDLRVYAEGLGEAAIAQLATGEQDVANELLAAHWRFDATPENTATFTPDIARNRIAMVGGTLIADMERYGYLEAAITSHWPHHDITFRNLGWPADDVFGTARSEFGSARNTRSWKPPGAEAGFGFDELMRQVGEVNPTTVIVGYGGETAFLQSDAQWADWQQGYRNLLDALGKTGAKLILATPIRQEKHGDVLPDPAENNKRLARTQQFILAVGKERGLVTIDNFRRPFGAWYAGETSNPAYSDGIHLNDMGHHSLSHFMAEDLGISLGGYALYYAEGNGRKWVTSDDGNTHTSVRIPGDNPSWMTVSGGVATGQVATKRGVRLDARLDRLPANRIGGTVMPPWHEEGDPTPYTVRIDGTPIVGEPSGSVVAIRNGPDQIQAEELRQKIIEKNRFHRYKLRPINKAYIFLFRRHEMGHLAYEMGDFDELIADHERAIRHLRQPRTHSYAIERLEPWKSPRDYPDHEVPKDIPDPNIDAELAAFEVAEGFEVNLFASNPMIANPINLNWDTSGRAWVSTSSTYPHIKPGREPDDRIVILEDKDGDGVADKHTVFAEGLTVPHSVMPVKGGAYVCSTTELLFLADANGDDISESRTVVFSGFGNADVHHMIHGLRWAPWGDLHFVQSIYINSFVETPHGPRRMNGSGIWRFRPETRRLDAFAVGMVNPWGFAFDRWGQSFGTDGAGGSGPHYVFPGSAFNSAVGAHRVLGGLIPGKPKNTAAEFVSGRHMPDHWQGSLLANDFRANRTVRYKLTPQDSGYTAEEVETVLHSSHRSFRPVDLKMGPEGALYVVDWYNPIIDHGEVDFHHPLRDKSHGRIWRITAKGRPPVARPEIAGAPVAELLELLKAPEQYTRTQAMRQLATQPRKETVTAALDWVAQLDPSDPDFEHHRLEGLWLLGTLRAGAAELLTAVLRSPAHEVRAAAVRSIPSWPEAAPSLDRAALLATAVEDEHPQVRLEAVNALRALGTPEGANLALRALAYPTDNNLNFALELTVRALRDQWLPAMQAGKQVFDGAPSRLAFALKEVGDPRAIASLVDLLQSGGIASEDVPNAVATVTALGEPGEIDAVLQMAADEPRLLTALAMGASGARHTPSRAGAVVAFFDQAEAEIRIAAAQLAGIWGVADAKPALIAAATRPKATFVERRSTCDALARLSDAATLRSFVAANQAPDLRAAAAAAWAGADPKAAGPSAAQILADLTNDHRDAAEALFSAFLAHGNGPSALAAALGESTLKEPVAIAGVRRAYASGRDVPDLIAAINRAGGLQPISQNLSPGERRDLLAEAAERGDADRGREIYQRKSMLCTTCHLIDNKGGRLGPDLSTVGSYMTAESLLESLLNPSTDIKQGYETVLLTTKDNNVVTGLLQRKTGDAHLIRDPSGTVISIPNADIAKLDSSPVSLMPPGLTASLRRDELVDLMRYLTSLGKRPD